MAQGKKYRKALFALIFATSLIIISVWLQDEKEQYPMHFAPELTRKWIIINGHDNSLTDLCETASVKFNGWNILLVKEESKSIHTCKDETSKKLQSGSTQHISSEVETSSMLKACLHAILEGGEAIYFPPETWMSSNLSRTGVPLKLRKNILGLISKEFTNNALIPGSKFQTFASNRHFGCIHPEILAKYLTTYDATYDLCKHEKPAILAPIAVPNSEDNCFGCDTRAATVTVRKNVFVYNLQMNSAVYTGKAFWALVFPVLFKEVAVSNTCIIALMYLVQKLIWSANSRVLLWHNAQNKIRTDDMEIAHLDGHTINIINLLHDVSCNKRALRDCLSRGLKILGEKMFLDQEFIETVEMWFDTLRQLNLSITYANNKKDECAYKDIIYHSVDYSRNCRNSNTSMSSVPVTNLKPIEDHYRKTCVKDKMNVNLNFAQPWVQLKDVLLIVMFNYYHFDVIPYIEVLYRPFFPNILYCGPSGGKSNLSNLYLDYKFSFVTYPDTPFKYPHGSFNYECAAVAISMNYDIAGYSVMGDDAFISVPKLVKYPRDVVWFSKFLSFKKASAAPKDWPTWHHLYRQSKMAFMQAMRDFQEKNSAFRRCYQQLRLITGSYDNIYLANADFYYIPSCSADSFAQLAWLSRSKELFLELAVPTMLACIGDKDSNIQLRDMYVWGDNRTNISLYINNQLDSLDMYHPVKWNPFSDNYEEMRYLFCYKLLPFLHKKTHGNE